MADKRKFSALAELRQSQETVPSASPLLVPTIQKEGRGRPAGKRSNPDFQPTTVLLRKATKRAVSRKLEDAESRQDLSDLIEQLLTDWLGQRA